MVEPGAQQDAAAGGQRSRRDLGERHPGKAECEHPGEADEAQDAERHGRQPDRCGGKHPAVLRPVRIGSRLAWPMAGIRSMLGVA